MKKTSGFKSKNKFLNKIDFRTIDFIFCIFVFLFLIYAYKLYDLQIVNGSYYREKLNSQYFGRVTGTVLNRGDILFKDKDGKLSSAAVLQSNFKIAIDNRVLVEPEKVYNVVSDIIPVDKNDFFNKTAKKDDPYEEIVRNVSSVDAKKIKSLNLPGVIIVEDKNRNYPHNSLASNVIGFLSYVVNDLEATYGVERYYDSILQRNDGNLKVNIFADIFKAVKNINNNSILEKNIAKEGNIVLTIEPTVQSFLEKEIDIVNEKFNSNYTAGMIMDPRSGKIISLAISDNFDINSEKRHYINYFIEQIHEFGSIFKPLTLAIALDSDSIKEDFSYNDKGTITLNTKTFYNFDKKGRGDFTNIQTIISKSLNTGSAEIALKIGKKVFSQYLDILKLGEKSGIDLPNEVEGRISNVKRGKLIELATASFGQGIAPSAISLSRAIASLSNGGYLVRPHVVGEINYGDLIPSRKLDYEKERIKVFDTEVTKKVTQILINSVDEYYFGGKYSNKDYAVAAKTGTAQIASNIEGYKEDAFLHSYFGYFPNYNVEDEDDKFFIFLFTVEPKGINFASGSLTDTFFNTVNFLINYYEVKPDRLVEEI